MIIKEWPVKLFMKFYPEFNDAMICFASDPDYIVRTKFDDNGKLTDIEVGYKEDDWLIPEPQNEIKD